MARNQFSDMNPRKRSIRDIPLPSKSAPENIVRAPRVEQAIERPEKIEVEDGYFAKLGSSPEKKGSKKWWFLALLIIGGGFWGASVFFHAATVEVTPEKAEYKGVIDIVAKTDASPTELQYDSLQFTESASKKLSATTEEDVSIKATGKVMVFNTYSTASQKLVANTRFEAANGKIYRIQEAVTVPGYKTADGKKVPGSVEAVIYADVAGDAYNSTKTDFTIPGFKGSAQYQGFYARSTTDITGGFVGKQKKVDEKVLTETVEVLKAEVTAKVSESIARKIPADFIFISGGSTIDFVTKPVASEGDQAVITVEARIHAYVFKKEGIHDVLKRSVQGITAEKVLAHDYTKLSVAKIIENEGGSSIEAILSGEAQLYAVIDKDLLAKELAGVKKSLIGTVMNTHPEIVESQVYIRPPWMMSLPMNPERVRIVEQIDE